MEVRPGRPAELAAVMTVFDNGGLAVDSAAVRAGLADGRVLVAAEDGRVLGTLLLVSQDAPATAAIEAVAVRRRRRGQGIGTGLVRAAADRHGRLVAEFDERVRPFWVSVGFEVEPAADPGRYVGTRSGTDASRW